MTPWKQRKSFEAGPGRYERNCRDAEADPVRRSLCETPLVLLTGEIFVRNDDLSRQYLTRRLAEYGLAAKVSGLDGMDFLHGLVLSAGPVQGKGETPGAPLGPREGALHAKIREGGIKDVFAATGLYPYKLEEVADLVRHTSHLINPQLAGEAILTVGSALQDILEHYCGVIAIGPFGCMPNRVAEAVLSSEMTGKEKSQPAEGQEADGKIQELAGTPVSCDRKRRQRVPADYHGQA